ncbi:hypothetical protein GOP47_0028445 [Adiantum capillus-veneris]|nr:hypothetical protein GOP47_0028445 [Adiantum capillus-veneris]
MLTATHYSTYIQANCCNLLTPADQTSCGIFHIVAIPDSAVADDDAAEGPVSDSKGDFIALSQDLEYVTYNPVAYDLANHFCEMAANYHTDTHHLLDFLKYPDVQERKRFTGAYLGSRGKRLL